MKHLTALIGLFLLISCSSQPDTKKLTLKEQIFRKSQRILNNHDDQKIWNIISIDTSDIKIYKGCFISPNDSVLFISINGEVEEASGFGMINRLNLVGHINDSLIVDYYQQGALPKIIQDFDNDGIDDFYFEMSSSNMGICIDYYLVVNFSNRDETFLFKRIDESVLECGALKEESNNIGDTLSTSRSLKFIDFDNDKNHEIIMTNEYKIYNGGKSEENILDSLKIIQTVDTIRIKKN